MQGMTKANIQNNEDRAFEHHKMSLNELADTLSISVKY